jgi:hypothetical protein
VLAISWSRPRFPGPVHVLVSLTGSPLQVLDSPFCRSKLSYFLRWRSCFQCCSPSDFSGAVICSIPARISAQRPSPRQISFCLGLSFLLNRFQLFIRASIFLAALIARPSQIFVAAARSSFCLVHALICSELISLPCGVAVSSLELVVPRAWCLIWLFFSFAALVITVLVFFQ